MHWHLHLHTTPAPDFAAVAPRRKLHHIPGVQDPAFQPDPSIHTAPPPSASQHSASNTQHQRQRQRQHPGSTTQPPPKIIPTSVPVCQKRESSRLPDRSAPTRASANPRRPKTDPNGQNEQKPRQDPKRVQGWKYRTHERRPVPQSPLCFLALVHWCAFALALWRACIWRIGRIWRITACGRLPASCDSCCCSLITDHTRFLPSLAHNTNAAA